MVSFNRVLLTSVSLLALAASPLLQGDDSHVRIVRVSYAEGSVQVNNQGVTLNAPLIEGNVLSTGPDSFAEVEFEDGSTMRLAPNTSVTFAQLARRSTGEALTGIDMNDGEAEFNVAPLLRGELFAVTAHEKNIRVEKSGRFRVLSTSADPLELAVWKGDAIVHDPRSGEDVAVGKGETFTVAAEDPQQYEVEKGVDRDGLDDFCELRDQELAQNYVSSNRGQTSVSPLVFSSFGFLDPCGPYYWYGRLYYWYPGIPASCFNSFAFYYQPYPVVYLPGYPYHHHHHHPPHIHPPIVAAAASVRRVSGAIPARLGALDSAKHVVRMFGDESFKRSSAAYERVEQSAARQNRNAEMKAKAEGRGRELQGRGNHTDSRHAESVRAFSSRQSSSSNTHSGSSHSSSSAYSGARSFSGSSTGVSSHSSGGFSGGGSASHSSSSSSSSSGSSGRSH